MLFDNTILTNLDPAKFNDKTYDYFFSSARKDVSVIRRILNEWFENYPVEERAEMKSRFKKTFSSAFYELFLYTLFRCQGFSIIIHPKIPNSNKSPDFLLKKGDNEFYIEAKEAKDETDEQQALKKRTNHIYDSLNTVVSPNFYLKIEELILKTTITPSTKQIIKIIEIEVKKTDPDKTIESIHKFGVDKCPCLKFEDANLKLVVSLLPKDQTSRNKTGTFIGMYPFTTFWGGAEGSIKKSFSTKAKRYGKLDKPYIICINALGSRFSGEYDVENAVWGSIAFSWSEDPNNPDEKLVRQRNGIFFDNNGPTSQNVSGILITKVNAFNVPVSNYWLIKHPFANNNIDFDIFNMTYHSLNDGELITEQGKTVGEILNIKTSWLDDKENSITQ